MMERHSGIWSAAPFRHYSSPELQSTACL